MEVIAITLVQRREAEMAKLTRHQIKKLNALKIDNYTEHKVMSDKYIANL